MELTYCGCAGLVFKSGSSSIAFDPFGGYPYKKAALSASLEVLSKELEAVQAVFVTHGHLDHILHIPLLFEDHGALIYATKTPGKTLLKHGLDKQKLVEIQAGETLFCGAFRVLSWHAKHCRFDLRLILKTVFCRRFFSHPWHLIKLLGDSLRYPENNEILFYELQAEGLRIQVMGSLNLDENIVYPTAADYLILPYQGRSDLAAYALGIVRRLKPKAVLLDHYDDSFPPLSAAIDPAEFIQLCKELNIPCRQLPASETIRLN